MVATAFVVTSSAAETTTTAQSILKLKNADANADGNITTDDAKLFLEVAAGIKSAENSDEKTYDVDADGQTSVVDAVAVLKESAGIKGILTTEEVIELFNNRVNLVKSTTRENIGTDEEKYIDGALPGFEKTTTMKCNSMLITTSGAPLAKLNVTNMEYNKYVDLIVDTMSSPLFAAAMDDAMKQQLKDMEASAVEAYKPQSQVATAETGSDVDHRSLYPIPNIQDASRLTVADVASAKCTMSNNHLVYTITMGTYTYTGSQYPVGYSGNQTRLKTPYGKAFSILTFNDLANDGSTLNSITYKNGKITLIEDIGTGSLVESHYSYSYESDVSAPDQDGMKMKTIMKSDVKEDFLFY